MGPLDPSDADVRQLDDRLLVELVTRLCRCEARKLGLAATDVTAGGPDASPDGGIDVRVRGHAGSAMALHRLPAGLQVKATRMTTAKIEKEMRPHGQLRASIRTLLAEGGAYIIAAGRENLADDQLQLRIAAMGAAAERDAGDQLHFYDSGRLAAWAADNPGVATWLRDAAGRPVRGWRGLGPWSAPDVPDMAYLIDDAARIGRADDDSLLDVSTGLEVLRQSLAQPRSVVRLVGLSGMGKTRLAEALFDPNVGSHALDPSLPIYGDAGHTAVVSPATLAAGLVDDESEAVLIVDNCPAGLHGELRDIVRRLHSRLRLLTIDFDIGPDQPRDTTVFRMQKAGDDLIEALLRQRTDLKQADRRRVADFSDGNTRIALVVARGPSGAKGLAHLRDQDLLDRLFLTERRGADAELRRVATVAALVFAFSVEGDEAVEAQVLADLAGVSAAIFHEKLGELLERGLAQQRGDQRAILPQTIAAWLAAEALVRCSRTRLMEVFTREAPTRLQASFTRRLAVLDGVAIATELAEVLLAPGGRYGDPGDDRGLDMKCVRNLAPLAPKAALDVAERRIRRLGPSTAGLFWTPGRDDLVRMLRAIAYEPEHFERAVNLLADLAVQERSSARPFEGLKDKVVGFFHINRCGTHASPQQRFAVIDAWLASPDEARRTLGIAALAQALDTANHAGDWPEAFGSRPRDTGWYPRDTDALTAWFDSGLKRLERLLAEDPCGDVGRRLILKSAPSLLGYPTLDKATLNTLLMAKGDAFWAEGWVAACDGLWRLKKRQRTKAAIEAERATRPQTLRDQFDVWLRIDHHAWRDPDDLSQSREDYQEAGRRAVGLGEQCAADHDDLVAMVLGQERYWGPPFGEGIANGSQDPEAGWRRLRSLADALGADLNWRVFAGYLRAVRRDRPDLADDLLGGVITDPVLRPFSLHLIASRPTVTVEWVRRIVTLLDNPEIDSAAIAFLSHVQLDEDVDDDLRATLIDALVARGELTQAIALAQGLFAERKDRPWTPALLGAARSLLAEVRLGQPGTQNSEDRWLAKLADRALVGPEGVPAARSLLDGLVELASRSHDSADRYPKLIKALFRRQTRVALEVVMPAMEDDRRFSIRYVLNAHDDDDHPSHNALATAPADIITDWLGSDPPRWGPVLADVVSYFERGADHNFEWTPLARALVDTGDRPTLEALGCRFDSGSSSGSWGSRWIRRRPMTAALLDHSDPVVRDWAAEMVGYLDRRIKQAVGMDGARAERFE